jgi:hypothetical protein
MLKTLFIVVPGLIWYAVTYVRQGHTTDDLRGGVWLVAHLAFLYALSAVGSFDGLGWIPAPWDSVVVAVVSFGVYFWGTASATAHMHRNPDLVRDLGEREPEPVESG